MQKRLDKAILKYYIISMRHTKKQTLVQKHLSKKFEFGGETKTKAEILIELQKITSNQKYIDAYMIGLELKSK